MRGLPNPFTAGRYHSPIVDAAGASSEFEPSAWTEDGLIMGCRMRGRAVEGVLFHPESFLTDHGARIFDNFVTQQLHVVCPYAAVWQARTQRDSAQSASLPRCSAS